MIPSPALAAVFLAIVSITIKALFWKKQNNLPPGPTGIPIVGYLHKICSKPICNVMNELCQTFGDIFCMQLGSRLTVVLNSREAIYEAFVKKSKQFAGRPDLATFNRTRHGCVGVSMCDFSEDYKRNRRMTVKVLHRLLANEQRLNQILQDETTKMTNLFDDYAANKTSFSPLEEFYRIVPSIVVNVIFGRCFDYDDKKLLQLVNFNRKWFESAEGNNPADYFKILEMFPNQRLKTIQECGAAFYGYILQRIDEHEEGTDGMLQIYLELFRENLGKKDLSKEDKYELARVIADILGGGFDTVAITLGWALLYLARQPDVMQACRTEINNISGNRHLHIDFNKQMPFFSATIYEILRMSSTAPMGLPRNTTTDVKLRNFTIPKNTMVFANLWSVNNDKSQWVETEKLYPGNFLTHEGEIDHAATRKLATFSSGIRRCPGDKFAFVELFVVLGTFIKKFDFEIVAAPETMEPSKGLTSQPKDYTIKLNHVEPNNNV